MGGGDGIVKSRELRVFIPFVIRTTNRKTPTSIIMRACCNNNTGGGNSSRFWFRLLRFFPFLLVSALTSQSPLPLSFGGILKNQKNGFQGNNNDVINSGNDHQHYADDHQQQQQQQQLQLDNTMNGSNGGIHNYPWNQDHYHISHLQKGDSNTGFSSNRTTTTSSNNSIDGGPPRPLTEEDQKFLERIQSSIQTVQNWDKDIQLLKECRSIIPWDELRDPNGPYSNPNDDRLLQGNALFLQRLARWFPQQFMSWVNTPPCSICGYTKCEMKTVRSAETQEEKAGEAKRVEVYYCPECKENTTTFPRYNRAQKLLETRQGRCGEYSNLFGLFCRSVGFETRLVLDLTDHLWTEVRLEGDSWIMADACEGIIDKPSMYEYGWDKDGLCYMIAIGSNHILDVTPRYTRQYLSEEFQNRRRSHTSSEDVSALILRQLNMQLQENLTLSQKEELAQHLAVEGVELHANIQAMEWTEEEKYGRGRISGSRQWRLARGETNNNINDNRSNQFEGGNGSKNNVNVPGFEIETLAPPIGPTLSLLVRPNPTTRHNGIVVLDTSCAVGQANSISLVVVDEACLGCILQSRSFMYWQDAKEFIDRLPSQRIVIMNGKCTGDETIATLDLPRLGGWKNYINLRQGVLFIGQVDVHPDWAFCSTLEGCPSPEGHEVILSVPSLSELRTVKLRQESHTMPQRIAGRLPEFAMPLHTQLLATEEEKHRAFVSYVGGRTSSYCGYTSKPHCPIYLLDGTSYPLERIDDPYAETSNLWNTFHYLPEALVPSDQDMHKQKTTTATSVADVSSLLKQPKYTVPLHANFFSTTFGRQLIGSRRRKLPTSRALRNSRLVGLYFASQWVDDCRNFTPLLAETYQHLKQVRPAHGLEIVFVSTDRDPGSFESFFSAMPWHAIPYDQSKLLMENLTRTFDVRHFPHLVIIDSVSGKVIVSGSESQREVTEAYQGGQTGIEHLFASWLDRAPPQTQIVLSRMDLPIKNKKENDHVAKGSRQATENHPYLILGKPATKRNVNYPLDAAGRIREIFDHFVSEGVDPNTAGEQAVGVVEEEERSTGRMMHSGPLNGKAIKVGIPGSAADTVKRAFAHAVNRSSRDVVAEMLLTTQMYVRQAFEEPWSPHIRTFHLSSDIADRITCVEGGLALVQSLGLEVFGSNHDFKATIPVSADLRVLDSRISFLLQELDKVV